MADLVGKTLGPYQIQALLGSGGMGQVYRARDPRLDREVAIKVLSATLAQEPGYSVRFQREAKAAAKLNHPNIVPVFDVGEQGGLMYLVMPLIPGGTLREYLAQRGALPLNEAVSIIEQVAGALQQAHERGMIHRDVKPANILMSAEGRALLTDFGIVRVAQSNESATPLTRIGAFVGSPEYAAPEMVTGQSADHRVDIYALGIMLYQMLTGRLPFVGSNAMALLVQRVQQEAPAPRSINPAISPAVEAVIMKAMAKTPAARYQSATELVQALKAAAGGQALPTLYGETGTQSQMSDLAT
ncbi:MAG TPA: protein kinase, partial [Ktedonobacterales bacterium]